MEDETRQRVARSDGRECSAKW
jgi:hypothetical protein